jgi:hypothetical protein
VAVVEEESDVDSLIVTLWLEDAVTEILDVGVILVDMLSVDVADMLVEPVWDTVDVAEVDGSRELLLLIDFATDIEADALNDMEYEMLPLAVLLTEMDEEGDSLAVGVIEELPDKDPVAETDALTDIETLLVLVDVTVMLAVTLLDLEGLPDMDIDRVGVRELDVDTPPDSLALGEYEADALTDAE